MQVNLRELLSSVEQVANNATQLQISAHNVSEGSSSQNASTSHTGREHTLFINQPKNN
jgi:uncharacterized protein YacL (UPF0231 family)